MLKLLNKNLRLLCNRLGFHSHRHSNPKIVIRKSHSNKHPNQNNHDHDHQQQHKPQNPKNAAVYPNSQMGTNTKTSTTTHTPIRIASFNASLFSMAPAVVPNSNNLVFKNSSTKSFDDRPKGILKQSPLHPTTLNLNSNSNPDTITDSLTKQQKFAKSKLRVSINLPDNEISLGRSRRIGFLDEAKAPARSSSERRNIWVNDHNNGSRNYSSSSSSSRAVVDVLRELNADIIGLQDVKAEEEREMKPLSDLAAALGMNYVFAESWAPEYGNAVLSKWPIKKSKVQKIFDDSDFRNVLKTTIDVPQVGDVNFYCTHLDHLDENWRMKQINSIIESNNEPHILAGGINSLDETDYSQERWTDIVKYYEDIGKPTPKAEVMRFLKDKQYTDSKDFAGECESVVMIAKGQSVQGTCKYGTRVDYILGSPGSDYKFVPGSYAVLSSKGTSDHHIVKVDIIKMKESIPEISPRKKQQPKKRVVKITSSSAKGIWSTDMR